MRGLCVTLEIKMLVDCDGNNNDVGHIVGIKYMFILIIVIKKTFIHSQFAMNNYRSDFLNHMIYRE